MRHFTKRKTQIKIQLRVYSILYNLYYHLLYGWKKRDRERRPTMAAMVVTADGTANPTSWQTNGVGCQRTVRTTVTSPKEGMLSHNLGFFCQKGLETANCSLCEIVVAISSKVDSILCKNISPFVQPFQDAGCCCALGYTANIQNLEIC